MKICILIIAIVALETSAFAQPSAEDLYSQGQAAYDRGDYATAASKWQASYDMSSESGLLFNLAQAKRLAGDCTNALATYRRFLASDEDPTSEQHGLANDLVRDLERKCPDPKPVVTAPTIESYPTPDARDTVRPGHTGREGRAWKIAGIGTGGVGVVSIAIGLGLGHRGASIGDEVTAACQTSCDWASLKDKDARGQRYVSIGRVLDVAGVVGIAGGAVMYYLGVRQGVLTIAPSSREGGAAVSWSQTW